jgi:hypothetical protein
MYARHRAHGGGTSACSHSSDESLVKEIVVGHQVEKEMTTATKFFVDIEGDLVALG